MGYFLPLSCSFLPEETQVSISAYSIHRDPKYFYPLTDTWWPERWIKQDEYTAPTGEIIPASQVITDKDVFMPFSLGPMICIGKNIAILEIRTVLSALVHNFDIKIADQTSWEKYEGKLGEVFVVQVGVGDK